MSFHIVPLTNVLFASSLSVYLDSPPSAVEIVYDTQAIHKISVHGTRDLHPRDMVTYSEPSFLGATLVKALINILRKCLSGYLVRRRLAHNSEQIEGLR